MDENGEYGQEPTERERSAAEMEALHQAMMASSHTLEELGIGRKDALPLEDRAANVPMVPLKFPTKRVRPENPASAWHNLSLDDIEPGLEDLEDIAGGQLYRIRRGGSGLSSGGRGGHSAGRGRGGASNRGGHASVGGRGNFAPKGRNVDHSSSGQTYFNDARRGGKSHATVDAGIARLQREAEFSRMHRTEGRSVKMAPSAPRSAKAALRAASHPVTRATSPVVPRPTPTSKFKLVSSAAFLSHANISSSPAARVVEPVISVPQPNTGNGFLVPPPASNLAPQGGLAASRWAASPATLIDTTEPNDPHQLAKPTISTSTPASSHSVRSAISATPINNSHSDRSIQPATVPGPLTLVTNGLAIRQTPVVIRTVVDERSVKASKNNSLTTKQGIVRLVKSDERSPLTLELQIGSDIIFSELLTETATLKVDINTVTYRADSNIEQTPIWKFQFQLPGPAKSFVNYNIFKLSELRRNNGCPSHSSEDGNQSSLMPPSPVPSSPVQSSAVSGSSNTTALNDTSYFTNRISSATFADLAEINGQEMLFSLHEEEIQPEDNETVVYSSFQDLLSLMEGDIVEGTLQVLNADHGGSFIDHISQLAKVVGLEDDADFMKHAKNVFIGGLSSSRYSNSKPIDILSVTEGLVADFLKKSKTLLQFPQEFIDTYIKEISKKILDKAQNPQNANETEHFNYTESFNPAKAGQLVNVSEIFEAAKPAEAIKAVKAAKPTEDIKAVAAAKPTEDIKAVEAVEPATVIKSVDTSDLIPRQERIIYSIEEMMKMRPAASLTRKVFEARDSLQKYLPGYKREIAPAEVVQTTDLGVRIVAGKSRGPQYKDSHRATATKLQPSEWKTRFATTASKQGVPQVIHQHETVEKQPPQQKRLAPESLSVENANYNSSEGADRQDSLDKGYGTSFSKLSPAEWKTKFSVTPSNHTSSKLTKVVKEDRITGSSESTENAVLSNVSAENNVSKSSANAYHSSLSDKSSGTSFIDLQVLPHNVPKDSATTIESEVKFKVESGSDTSPLVLPSNRGLGTSRYATSEVVNQADVLRATSGYKHPPRQIVKKQDSSDRSSGSSTPLRSTQVHDPLMWEKLLSSRQSRPSIEVKSPEATNNEPGDADSTPEFMWDKILGRKQRQPFIEVESPQAPKSEPKDAAFTPEPQKSVPVTISHKSVLESNPTVPTTQAVSKVNTASNSKQVLELKDMKQKEAPITVKPVTVVETGAWVTVDRSGNKMAKNVNSQETNPFALKKATEKETTVPKVECHLTSRSRHAATDSEIDRLAQVLSNLDVKTDKDNGVVIKGLPVPERSSSPTIEEILQKKRANGLATSKWASPQAPVFKPASRTSQSTPAGYSQQGSNKPQYDTVFSSQNSHHNPFVQTKTQSPYGEFSHHENQYSFPQEQSSQGLFSPEVSHQYPVMSTVLVTDPVTGKVTEVTGISVRTHVPVAHMPPAYVGHSPPTARGFTSSGSFSFPPRPTMFDKSFSDSDSEDVLKATAPVFTPSHQRDGSAMTRSALSPVLNRQNAQQEAVQARLNKSLAEQRM
ncbi:hypothetical protein NHQ30_008635 [Ciborinia camelliae]|nr:hypothetical protein NHQ30_008635 [Ciborinia camelliae]